MTFYTVFTGRTNSTLFKKIIIGVWAYGILMSISTKMTTKKNFLSDDLSLGGRPSIWCNQCLTPLTL
jgi:hypothetical protein